MTESKDISKHIALHSLFKSISGSFISLFVPVIIYTSSDLFNTILYLIITNLVVSLRILLFYKFINLNALTSIIFSFQDYFNKML